VVDHVYYIVILLLALLMQLKQHSICSAAVQI